MDVPRPPTVSHAMEDYLKSIFLLGEEARGPVTTSKLAVRLDVSVASATNMLKKLAEFELVSYEPYRGVTLTPAGRKVALEIVRHHRLIELYLVEALGMGWDEVHDEAERLEHVISEEFEARIAKALKDPRYDPHGDPIPTVALDYEGDAEPSLDALEAGATGVVSRVSDRDPAKLRALAGLGLTPRSSIVIVTTRPLTVRVGGGEARVVPSELAALVQIRRRV